MATTSKKSMANGTASSSEIEVLTAATENTEVPETPELPYEDFVEILSSGKYSGELWAELEREKIRAQVEIKFASTRNNDNRLQAATDRLRRAVDEQKAIETEFPSAQVWGKYFISTEAVTARQAENNTPK